MTMLLFLLLPSCIVAAIGKLANKFSFSSVNCSTSTTAFNFNTSLPAMSTANSIGMDTQIGQVPSNNFEVRGRNPVSSVNISRESSMASSGRSTPYHDRMNTDMDCNLTIKEPSTERLEMSYKTEQEKVLRVGIVANQQETLRPMDVNNEATPSYVQHEDDVINI